MGASVALSGCVSQRNNLKSDDCETKSLDSVYFVRCGKDAVNRRCTRGKLTWDDGSKYDPADESRWARCCTVFPHDRRKKYQIYVTRGEEECLVHEFCHIEIYERDGQQIFWEHHKRCHDFGFGKTKERPGP